MMTYTQCGYELEAFLSMCRGMGCERYIELGTDTGISARKTAEILSPIQVVTIDIRNQGYTKVQVEGSDLHFLQGDSHDVETKKKAVQLLGGPPDVVFIDADHTYDAARSDFEMWWPAAQKVVGFHDIYVLGSKVFWDEIKLIHPSIEISSQDKESLEDWVSRCGNNRAGIGVLFRDPSEDFGALPIA